MSAALQLWGLGLIPTQILKAERLGTILIFPFEIHCEEAAKSWNKISLES